MDIGREAGLLQVIQAFRHIYEQQHQHLSESERGEGWSTYWKTISAQVTSHSDRNEASGTTSSTRPAPRAGHGPETVSKRPDLLGEPSACSIGSSSHVGLMQQAATVVSQHHAEAAATHDLPTNVSLPSDGTIAEFNAELLQACDLSHVQLTGGPPFTHASNAILQDHHSDPPQNLSATVDNAQAAAQWPSLWDGQPVGSPFDHSWEPSVTETSWADLLKEVEYLNDRFQSLDRSATGSQTSASHVAQAVELEQPQSRFAVERVMILRQWLTSNLHDPFPDADAKERLASASGLSIRQIERWFVRTRASELVRLKWPTGSDDLVGIVPVPVDTTHPETLPEGQAIRGLAPSVTRSSLVVAVATPPGNFASGSSLDGSQQVAEARPPFVPPSLNQEHIEQNEGSLVSGWLASLPNTFELLQTQSLEFDDVLQETAASPAVVLGSRTCTPCQYCHSSKISCPGREAFISSRCANCLRFEVQACVDVAHDTICDCHKSPSRKCYLASNEGKRISSPIFPQRTASLTSTELFAPHIYTHTEKQTYQCHCGSRFESKDNLRRHAKTVHLEEKTIDNPPATTVVPSQGEHLPLRPVLDSLPLPEYPWLPEMRQSVTKSPGDNKTSRMPASPHSRKRAAPRSTAGSDSTMSADSGVSCSSYTAFGPRKGRRVAYHYDNDNTPPRMQDTIPTIKLSGALQICETQPAATATKPDQQDIEYQCAFCGKRSTTLFQWMRHETSIHAPNRAWICGPALFEKIDLPPESCSLFRQPECWQKEEHERTFFRKDHMLQHLQGVHEYSEPKILGHRRAAALRLLHAHVELLVPPAMLQCPVCDDQCDSWSSRFFHLKRHFREGDKIVKLIPSLPFSSFKGKGGETDRE